MIYKKKLKKPGVDNKMLSRALQQIKTKKYQEDEYIHDEHQYLSLINDIIEIGEKVNGRNGVAVTVSGSAMHFSLQGGTIPLLTTKKVAVKTCLKELLWFVSGATDNGLLQKQNVKIWNGNASREFLDSRGLDGLRENDLGPVYGHQWRHFNAPYQSCDTDYTGKGVDQLAWVIEQLSDPQKRSSRRIVMSAWNPCQLDEMALPPCHVLVQFNVLSGNKLSCSLYQRSGDVGLGVPFNIASYSFLTHLLAKHCGLEAYDFNYHLGNCHIYDDHIEPLRTQMERRPHKFPTVVVKNKYDNIADYGVDDFEVNDYVCHEPIQMSMRK
jgi:thymidylate synthase